MKSVAVVLATYNGEKFLPQQLASLAQQTLKPTCLIVSDDKSTDGTLQLVDDFAKTAPFPVYVQQNEQQLGYGENFLSGASLARTDLIAFSDQDDFWLPSKLSVSVAAFDNPRVVLSAHTATLTNEKLEPIGLHHRGIRSAREARALTQDPWGFYSGFTMTFDRRLLEIIPRSRRGLDLNKPNELAAHDRWIYFLADALGSTARIAEPLALYRQHGRNLYGGGRPSLLKRLAFSRTPRSTLRERSEHYRVIAEHRGHVLLEAAGENALPAREQQMLRAAAKHWNAAARTEANRVAFYDAQTAGNQLFRFVSNLANGTYVGVNDGRPRGSAIARDALSLLAPARRVEAART